MADLAFLGNNIKAPFSSIRQLFDHLRAKPDVADALNATYTYHGLFKTAASKNGLSDQKFIIEISPTRLGLRLAELDLFLYSHGFTEVLEFFTELTSKNLHHLLSMLGATIGADLFPLHRSSNINFRLYDYTPDTAAPQSEIGCGVHRDYGTFSIVFQDETLGLEIESASHPGEWLPVPADSAVMLCGWSAFIVSGGELRAVRHRVRRQPGVRRLSAVLFVAPDLNVALKPIISGKSNVQFSPDVLEGKVNVGRLKEFRDKKWCWREGNAKPEDGEDVSQDADIERLILG
ncbi:Clavaminate synthase-like protein [Hypoxylon rubiginosum]|uniref:Clavaminate synthase-like protein n=1 Tax=Hypoxylon rubiginosum TaxID=110542 RepID=A0ACB9YP09_9PEZI|nr:Clavaminate synthase-like protein [Hypoxylon rubiginosum]